MLKTSQVEELLCGEVLLEAILRLGINLRASWNPNACCMLMEGRNRVQGKRRRVGGAAATGKY